MCVRHVVDILVTRQLRRTSDDGTALSKPAALSRHLWIIVGDLIDIPY
jgi:hypothetical protein